MTWSSISLWRKKARRGILPEAYGGIPTARPMVSDIPFAAGATELHQIVTEFRDEVDECVEQERRGWDEECV
jgi:hypothetical protein